MTRNDRAKTESADGAASEQGAGGCRADVEREGRVATLPSESFVGGVEGGVEGGMASGEFFRRLVDSVQDHALVLLDRRGRVVTWNPGAQHVTGYAAEEIAGKPFSTFHPERDGRDDRCAYALEVTSREGHFEDEDWRVRKGGIRFRANVALSALRDGRGELLGFSKVMYDLTERERALEGRASRLAAEQAECARYDVLAVLCHELHNPLAPVLTAVQRMKLRDDGRTSNERQAIERHAKHLCRLVDDMFDVARGARGALHLTKRPLALQKLVANAVEAASPLLKHHSHRLQVEAPSNELYVDADGARLTRALTNLLVNAATYTEPGGHVEVRVRQSEGEVVVEVRDDGRGIEPAQLPTLFGLFAQGLPGTGRPGGGLGVGLLLTRLIVGLHGGTVEARSPGAGRGSTFTVRLPTVR